LNVTAQDPYSLFIVFILPNKTIWIIKVIKISIKT
ncbi:MAG: hypothetical protein ACI8ZX_002053, partial [Planctomycetota bacterium]